MRKARYLTPSITMDYVNRQEKMRELNSHPFDPNVAKADLAANLFVFVMLVAIIVWLIIGD